LVFDVAIVADVPDIAGGVIQNRRMVATAVKMLSDMLLRTPTRAPVGYLYEVKISKLGGATQAGVQGEPAPNVSRWPTTRRGMPVKCHD
jgi:hypothetical protein